MIKAGSNDIDIISGYLHDAALYWSDVIHIEEEKIHDITVERNSYEQAKKSKLLFVIPIISYPSVKTRIRIRKVREVIYEWLDDAFEEDPMIPHTLLEIIKDENSIIILTEYLSIRIETEEFEAIEIQDVSDTGKRMRCFDFGKQVFYGIEEIDKLRIDQE
jgi:hypothetical protein